MCCRFSSILKLLAFIFVLYLILCGKFICPVKFFFKINCPACGLTRAIRYLLMLDFKKSIYYHPMAVFILPSIFLNYNIRRKNSTFQKTLFDFYLCVLAVLFLVVYLLRLNKNF